jgi:hypothetical protein
VATEVVLVLVIDVITLEEQVVELTQQKVIKRVAVVIIEYAPVVYTDV